jgi:thiamine-monophosphate kinase
LCFTAPVSKRAAVLRAGVRSQTPVTRIGRIVRAPVGVTGVVVMDRAGLPMRLTQRSFDHFG